VPGTIVEHDWMICSKLEEFVHIGWATKWIHKNFLVSCVCGTAGLAKSIGLGNVGKREKNLRLVKEMLYTLSFD